MLSLINHRVLNSDDLVAVEAIYHKICYANFFLRKYESVPGNKCVRGRPPNKAMTEASESTCEWFESLDQ